MYVFRILSPHQVGGLQISSPPLGCPSLLMAPFYAQSFHFGEILFFFCCPCFWCCVRIHGQIQGHEELLLCFLLRVLWFYFLKLGSGREWSTRKQGDSCGTREAGGLKVLLGHQPSPLASGSFVLLSGQRGPSASRGPEPRGAAGTSGHCRGNRATSLRPFQRAEPWALQYWDPQHKGPHGLSPRGGVCPALTGGLPASTSAWFCRWVCPWSPALREAPGRPGPSSG